ncbi:dihydrolipoyl dehydrogenase [Deinococcus sp.]|uniref:dihydrolipoyl dehydrogenase n=1 Tax=Deinococcus sp. TaxID=47478 RepID=UPI003B59C0F2
MTKTTHDAAIIGAGQAGGPLAGALARAGWRVAIIERKHVGGTCVNEGCTPTKTMVASAAVAHAAQHAQDYGVTVEAVSTDMQAVVARKQKIVDSFREGSKKSLLNSGAELIEGEARFSGAKTLHITLKAGGEQTLSAEHIFINTGARPSLPKLPGLESVDALNSTTIMELSEVPEHLLIIGGGYIGLEFAQMFARFGSRVSVIEHNSRLSKREDEDVSAAVQEALEADGVQFFLNADAQRVKQEDQKISLEFSVEGQTQTLSGSHLLVAVGRTPNTDALNLAAAGIATDDRGHVKVDEHLHTNVAGVYALGDVKGGPAFTHISYDDYRIVRDALLHGKQRSINDRPVPYVMYTEPQLARFGLDRQQAREKGQPVRIYTLPMSSVARAIELGQTRGLIRVVVDDERDTVLGATVLGVEGGELMGTLQVAMMGGVTASALRESVLAHPTLSEALNNLFSSKPERLFAED